MKPIPHISYSTIVREMRQEFFDHYTDTFELVVKAAFQPLMTRNLCYHKATNTLVFSNIHNGRVHLIDLTTGKLRWYDHHLQTVRDIKIWNRNILTASWDGTIRAVDFDSLRERFLFTDPYMGRTPYLTLSHDERYLLGYSYDSDKNPLFHGNKIRRWNLADGRFINNYGPLGTHRSRTRSGACVIHEGLMHTISDSGNLNTFDFKTGQLINQAVVEHDLRSMCLVPALNLILAGDVDGFVHFFDIRTGRFFQTRQFHSNEVTFMLIHPENTNHLFSCGFDGCLKAWELPRARLIGSVETGNNFLWAFRFINNLAVVCGDGGDIGVFDIRDPNSIRPRGFIKLFREAFLANSVGSSRVYTNDPSLLKVVCKSTGVEADAQTNHSVLMVMNDLRVLHTIFSDDKVTGTLDSGDSGPWKLLPVN